MYRNWNPNPNQLKGSLIIKVQRYMPVKNCERDKMQKSSSTLPRNLYITPFMSVEIFFYP